MPSTYADLTLKSPMIWGLGPRLCGEPACAKVLTGRKKKYCSRKCCVRHYQRTIWCPLKRRKHGEIEKVCAEMTCRKPFLQPAKARRKREYCQHRCLVIAKVRRKREKARADKALSQMQRTPDSVGQLRRVLLPALPNLDGAEVLGFPLHVMHTETGEANA